MPDRVFASLRHKADVLIITAVKDEQDVVLRSESDWREYNDPSGFAYFFRRDPGGLSWGLARAADMGPELAANVATRLIASLEPRCLAMVGVCAGWREKVQLGDVVVAERLFRYDVGKLRAYGEGAAREEEVFHDIRTYNLDPRWRQRAEDFSREWVRDICLHQRPVGYLSQELWLLHALGEVEHGVGKPPRDRDERTRECPDWTDVVARLERKGLIRLDGGLQLTNRGRDHLQEVDDLSLLKNLSDHRAHRSGRRCGAESDAARACRRTRVGQGVAWKCPPVIERLSDGHP